MISSWIKLRTNQNGNESISTGALYIVFENKIVSAAVVEKTIFSQKTIRKYKLIIYTH